MPSIWEVRTASRLTYIATKRSGFGRNSVAASRRASSSLVGLGQEAEECFVVVQAGIVGQRARDEGAIARGLGDVASGASSLGHRLLPE